jgi:hypothetical protein
MVVVRYRRQDSGLLNLNLGFGRYQDWLYLATQMCKHSMHVVEARQRNYDFDRPLTGPLLFDVLAAGYRRQSYCPRSAASRFQLGILYFQGYWAAQL